MDVLEKLNRRFGAWYEGLFGGRADDTLRPRDILRRLLSALEDARREGLDGQVYVPNVCTLRLTVENDDERQYLRTFLDADELAQAVAERLAQHGYKTRGPLVFAIEETAPAPDAPRVEILCRFDASAAERPAPPAADDDLHTVPAAAFSAAVLAIHGPDGRWQEIPLTARGVRIGRGKQAGNEIVLSADPQVSKRHARIACEGGRFLVYDEGSTNGTLVNDALLTPGAGWPLEDGDRIQIGQTTLTLRTASEPATAPAPARPAAPRIAFRLVAADGESYPLASRMLVGRALTDDIVLIGEGVSAQHAQISVRDGAVFVEDLDSPGGTLVNGERIPVRFPVALHPGDTLRFGQVALQLTGNPLP